MSPGPGLRSQDLLAPKPLLLHDTPDLLLEAAFPEAGESCLWEVPLTKMSGEDPKAEMKGSWNPKQSPRDTRTDQGLWRSGTDNSSGPGPDSKHLRLCIPCGNYSALRFECKSGHRQGINSGALGSKPFPYENRRIWVKATGALGNY